MYILCNKGWIDDIKAYNQLDDFDYPIISDPNRRIANLYGMLDPDEIDSKGLPLTCRSMFIIGPDKYAFKNNYNINFCNLVNFPVQN